MAWLELAYLLASVVASLAVLLGLLLWLRVRVERATGAALVADLQVQRKVQVVHLLQVPELCQAAARQQVAAARPAVCHACC